VWVFFRNVRYSARSLTKSPGFTLAAVLTLALGIGANTAVFSVVDAVVLRPLPYRDASQLVMVSDQLLKLGLDQFPVTFANYADYRRGNRVFEDIAAFNYLDVNLEGSADAVPERLEAMAVSANLFPLLGLSPILGRGFVADQNEPGHGDAVILSNGLWRRRFGADSTIIGRSIHFDGQSLRVQAVMPPGFAFTIRGAGTPDIWIPLTIPHNPPRSEGFLRLIARLKAGTSIQQAQANLTALAAGIEATHHPYTGPHGEDAGYHASVILLRDQLIGNFRASVFILAGAVVFVLLIACANVANLLLARGARRRQELAIRAALGASRRQILGELGAESLVLVLAGAGLGLLLANWAVATLPVLSAIPEQINIALDLRVLSFTLLLSLATALLFGLAPAVQSTRAQLDLTGGRTVLGQERNRLRSGLIVAEVALSVVLLIGAGLLLKSLAHLQRVEPGFNPHNLLTMQVTLPAARYSKPQSRIAFFSELADRLRQIPGVESAALVTQLPLAGGGRGGDPFSIEGRPFESSGRVPQFATRYRTTPDYFYAMRIPLLAGRLLDQRDSADAPPVAVVNQTLARGFWPRGNPIGQHIMLGAPRPGAAWLTIVGVVADVRGANLRAEALPQIYTPYAQDPNSSMVAVLRTSADPMSLALAARREISAVDRGQAASDVRTMDERLSASIQRERFETLILGIFALAALALAVIGIYGVLDHSVTQRVPEIGLRVALGAQPVDVLRLIVIEGMRPALLGLAFGLAAAFPLARVLRSLLFHVAPADPVTFFGVPVLFGSIALAACVIPARTAIRLDPAKALHSGR
jgi:putative ABC transport system permease protein